MMEHNEAFLKHHLIAYLLTKGKLANAVVIDEFVVSNWSRRADIVVANGRLEGYEVKSDVDNLQKLPGQIRDYQTYLDKVTVVTVERHASNVLESTPSNVAVLVAKQIGGNVIFRLARRGEIREVKNRQVLASLLRKDELLHSVRQLLSDKTIYPSREELVRLFQELSLTESRAAVIRAIKKRFSSRHLKILAELSDINQFNKSSRRSFSSPATAKDESPHLHPGTRPSGFAAIDTESINKKWGPAGIDIPEFVLLRKTSHHKSSPNPSSSTAL